VISLVETSHVDASPEQLWLLFLDMDRLYRAWHPEHLAWRTLRGDALAPRSVAFVDEWVGPLRLAARFFVEKAEPNRFFRYRIGLPFALLRAGGYFRFEPTAGGGSVVEAEVHFGFRAPVIGYLVDCLLVRVLPLSELRRHMREEGEALDRLALMAGRRDL